jgi:hypothetical protein
LCSRTTPAIAPATAAVREFAFTLITSIADLPLIVGCLDEMTITPRGQMYSFMSKL